MDMNENAQRGTAWLRVSDAKRAAVDALIAGDGLGDVAASVDIAESTLWRWRHEDAVFQAAYNERAAAVWDANEERLRSLAGAAINVMRDAMGEDQDIDARLRAAKAVLAHLPKRPAGETDPERVALERDKRRVSQLEKTVASMGR